MPSPSDPVAPLRPRVQRVLDAFLGTQRDLLLGISADLGPLVDTATELLGGGKRLRPAFCYWGWRAAGAGGDDDALFATAASLELFQAAALVHDDLIDASDTRRGLPAVHCSFAARHRASGWSGEPGAFGAAAAILLGDLLLGWSDELLARSGLDDAALHRARPIFDRMRTEVGAGQYLDILAQAHTAVDPTLQVQRARQVVVHKAARYSVQHPLALGGAVAAAPASLLASYAAYGAALGEAFQLRDDVLGVFGDPDQTGKPAGDDLREGKRTLLIAYALEASDAAQASVIAELLGDPELDSAGVDRLRAVLVETGALHRVESRITLLVDQAHAALGGPGFDPVGRDALATLIKIATKRRA